MLGTVGRGWKTTEYTIMTRTRDTHARPRPAPARAYPSPLPPATYRRPWSISVCSISAADA